MTYVFLQKNNHHLRAEEIVSQLSLNALLFYFLNYLIRLIKNREIYPVNRCFCFQLTKHYSLGFNPSNYCDFVSFS
jgi:hypothetical protein